MIHSYILPLIFRNTTVDHGKYLVPLHTAFNFMVWAPKAPFKVMFCNNEAVFIGPNDRMFGFSDALSELGKIYFSAGPAERSPALAEYAYGELCMLLDCFYGLKETHHISDFRSYFRANGYEEALLSPDPKEADEAVEKIIIGTLDDIHTSTALSSWMSGVETRYTPLGNGFSSPYRKRTAPRFEEAAKKWNPDGMDYYTESGNTAYVVIKSLVTTIDSDTYYSLDLDNSDVKSADDPVVRILYAHHQITRENSPIENVVLDLSLCPGGDFNSAACVVSWILGQGYLACANSFTGGPGIGLYRMDIDRDHQFTDEDGLLGRKNLYCLTAPITFSSGNLTAAMLKMSGVVTMLGQTTLGGSGMMTTTVTGWDYALILSGFRTIVTVKNGSCFDADIGVEPDVYLSDPDTFYNREALTEFINNLK